MKKIIPHIFFIVLLYLFFFNPQFWMFRGILGASNLFALAGIVLFMINPKPVMQCVRANHKVFNLMLFLLLFSFYSVVAEGTTRFLTQHFLYLVDCFLVIPQLIYYAKKNGFGSEDEIIRSVLVTVTVAAFISLLCIVSPDFNSYIKTDVIKYSQDNILFDMDYRGFGFAEELTGNYGFIMGFVAVLGAFYSSYNKWFLFVIPVVVIAALLNARTGVVITAIGVVIYFFFNRKQRFYGLLVAIMAIVLVANMNAILEMIGVSEESLKWLSYFQSDIEDTISTRNALESETANYLFNDKFILPSNFGTWIIGDGFYLFRNEHHLVATDVGWSNILNYGGLVYSIPYVYMMFVICQQIAKRKGWGLGSAVLITLLIVNTKTILFPSRTIFFIVMIMMFAVKQGSTHSGSVEVLKKQKFSFE